MARGKADWHYVRGWEVWVIWALLAFLAIEFAVLNWSDKVSAILMAVNLIVLGWGVAVTYRKSTRVLRGDVVYQPDNYATAIYFATAIVAIGIIASAFLLPPSERGRMATYGIQWVTLGIGAMLVRRQLKGYAYGSTEDVLNASDPDPIEHQSDGDDVGE